MNWLPLLTLLTVLEPAPPEPAEAPEPEGAGSEEDRYLPQVSLDLSVWSTYVWRGEAQYVSASTPSFQPDLQVGFPDLGPGTLTFDLWTAFSMAREDYRPENGAGSEIDLSLVYGMSLASGWLNLEVGFLYYVYPHADAPDGAKEVVLGLGLGNLPVSISVITYTTVHPDPGIYIEPMIGWEQEFGSFTVGMDLALAASVYRSEEAALQHTTLTGKVAHQVGNLSFWFNLSYALRLAPGAGSFFDRSLIYGGVGLTIDVIGPRE